KARAASCVVRMVLRTLVSNWRWNSLFERSKAVDAGIVDEDVGRAESGPCLSEQPLYIGALAHIGLDPHGLAAIAQDVADHPVRIILAGSVVDDDRCTSLGKLPGNGCADALGGAGDDRHFAFELVHDVSPLARMKPQARPGV